MDCLFCKIVAKEIPAEIVYENDAVLAFRDIQPVAPTHILVIPKKHIATANAIDASDRSLMGEMFLAAKEVARLEGLSERGHRLVMNVGEGGGQSVFHIHLHVIGGRDVSWPPG